jgi:GT2 family glycosyltransferase
MNLYAPEDVGKSHLIVGLPACGRMTTVRWAITLAAQNYPLSMSHNFIVVRGCEAGEARNKIAQYAKDVKAKLVWMLDDDVMPPPYAVQKLLHAMVNKPNVLACAGIVYTKSTIPEPLVFENNGSGPYYNWKRGKVFEVPGFISTGCMLIKTEAFEKLEYPWFKTQEYPDKVTEDVYFCLKAKKAGYKILGHGGVLCGHYDFKSKKVVVAPEDVVLESA